MKSVIIDIADAAVSSQPDEALVTYSLGSCLGVTFYDPVLRIGAMAHCMLPLSSLDAHKATEKPFMFVDVGVPKLLEEILRHGCRKRDLITRVAGGAAALGNANLFRIGERNFAVFRKIMWKNSLLVQGEDVGGDITRTLKLDIATGRLTVRTAGVERDL